MNRPFAALLIALPLLTAGAARADVGEPAKAVITRVQSSKQFAGVPSEHGALPGQHLERWKFMTANLEQRVFAVDAKSIGAPVARETYIRVTQIDPYSLRPGQITGEPDLADVLSPAEYRDFQRAAVIATIREEPLALVAYFYRGRNGGYEVLEPSKRRYGSPDRFEWRSFPRGQLDAMMKAARSCDNGSDCAAW
ncbi:MAG TPA: hypothetical protein VFN49_12490 [Candidatus Aquilonibacter sp.]|nr:hypothetical protein [Candidatus Aquilonibacter sp.]